MSFDDPQATKAIEAQHATFQKLVNDGETDRLVDEFYADDIEFLPPNAPPVRGKDALRPFMAQMPDIYSDVVLTTGSVHVSGDLAVVTGAFKGKMTRPDGSTVDDEGSFVEGWRRTADGSWKCFVDTFSSDLEHAT